MQGSRTANRQRAAKAVRHAAVVPDLVFVVVVPAGIDAVVEHFLLQVFLPPADSFGMSEVDVRALPVPELANTGSARCKVRDECPAGGNVTVRRMVVEQARLEIDDDARVLLFEPLDRCARCRKLVSIPCEHIASPTDARIA